MGSLINNKTMKKIALLVIGVLILWSCGTKKDDQYGVEIISNPATANGTDKKIAEKMPVLTFETVTHNFGKVIQGERLSYSFKFKNTGKSNLIISYVETSCGCTTSTPPKEPIAPGESGEIKVTFDSKTKSGEVTNQVMITANTFPVNTSLILKANVIRP
ncbi:MAG: hypothetical protein H6Q25_1248 [Bacteroidetes bacterium]|nr:hypothetical protein [Bacteroidota bacterium]